MRKKTVCFISSPDTLDKIVAGNVDNPHALIDQAALYVCSDWWTRERLKSLDLSYITFHDSLSLDDCECIDGLAANLAHTWYKRDGDIDFTLYKGISLGHQYEYDIVHAAVRIFKFLVGTTNILERAMPAQVFHDYPDGTSESAIVGLVARDLGIKYAALPQVDLPRQRDVSNLLHTWFIDHGTKATLKSWATFGLALVGNSLRFARLTPARPKDPLVLVHPSAQVYVALEGGPNKTKVPFNLLFDTQVSLSLRYVWRWALRGATFGLVPLLRRCEEAGEHVAALENISQNWVMRKADTQYRSLLQYRGYSIQECFQPRLDRLVRKHFPTLALETDRLLGLLSGRNVALVVVPNDATEQQRHAVSVARSLGIPSLVVQHGVLGWRGDRNHLWGQYSAVWSKAIKENLIQDGLHPDNVMVTGFAGIDSFAPVMTKGPLPQSRSPDGYPTLLIITTNASLGSSFAPETMVEDFIVGTVKTIVESRHTCHIKIKIHPIESVAYYQRLLECWLDRVQIVQNANWIDLLKTADLVISSGSTATLYALVTGRPVVFLCLFQGSSSHPRWLTDFRGVTTVYSISQFQKVLSDWFYDETALVPGDAHRMLVSDYIGKVDGYAGQRLIECIAQLTRDRAVISQGCCKVP